jgi:hypothetical protein
MASWTVLPALAGAAAPVKQESRPFAMAITDH